VIRHVVLPLLVALELISTQGMATRLCVTPFLLNFLTSRWE
jgi:hypothetical protein